MIDAGVRRKFVRNGPCKLCEKEALLQASHIVPAFAIRKLKNTSNTGFLRGSENINRRVQDGLKVFLLCRECEAIFSKYETQFSNKVFDPYFKNCDLNLVVNGWFLKFAVSLSWRIVAYLKIATDEKFSDNAFGDECLRAEIAWRDFLLDRRNSVVPYNQHLFVAPEIHDPKDAVGLPQNYHRHMLRVIEFDLPHSNLVTMTYMKIGPFCFFGHILNRDSKWKGTLIRNRKNRVYSNKYDMPASVGEYFIDRMNKTSQIDSKLSKTQKSKIDAALSARQGVTTDSEQWRSMYLDAAIFGESALIRKDAP